MGGRKRKLWRMITQSIQILEKDLDDPRIKKRIMIRKSEEINKLRASMGVYVEDVAIRKDHRLTFFKN